MKKAILLLFLTAMVAGGCTLNLPKSANSIRTNYNLHTNYNTQSARRVSTNGNEKLYALQKAVAAYAKAINTSGERCNLTGEEMAYCFSRRMYGNTYSGSSINMRNGDVWRFYVNGICASKGECKIVITSQGANYPINLWVDGNGHIMTDNPSSPY